jgi:hypothetical protein
MKSYSHWGMFPCWEQGLPPMVEQPNKSWVHVPIGSPYPITSYTLAEALQAPHEDDLKLTIVKT